MDMIILNQTIDFTELANDIGVDVEYLTPLFEVFSRECDRLFPLLENALENQNFSDLHEYSHALKGLIGNMRLDDLHQMITEIDNAAKTGNSAYPYAQSISLLKSEVSKLLAMV